MNMKLPEDVFDPLKVTCCGGENPVFFKKKT